MFQITPYLSKIGILFNLFLHFILTVIQRSWSLLDDQDDLPPLEPASEFIARFEAAPDRKRRLLQKLAKTILDPNFQFEIE